MVLTGLFYAFGGTSHAFQMQAFERPRDVSYAEAERLQKRKRARAFRLHVREGDLVVTF